MKSVFGFALPLPIPPVHRPNRAIISPAPSFPSTRANPLNQMKDNGFVQSLESGGKRSLLLAGVRRETGKEYEVKVLYGEGYAHHTGPEPCGVDREVGGEASAGGGVGQPLSRERQVIPGADDVPASEGNTNRREPSAGTVWPGVVLDPGMRSSSLRGNREVSCPSGARMRRRIASGRRGAVADDERAGEVRTPP